MTETMPVNNGPQIGAFRGGPIRLVAFDVDGTLVRDNTDHRPTDTFLTAVREATARGIVVCLDGARGINKMTPTIHQPIIDSAVTSELARYGAYANGALIYDAQTDSFVQKNTISTSVVAQVTSYLQSIGAFHWVHELRGKESVDFAYIGRTFDDAASDEDYGVPVDRWATNAPENTYLPIKYKSEEPLVIVAYGLREKERYDLEDLIDQYTNEHIKTVVYSFNELTQTYQIFVLHEKANKGDALRTLADLYRVQLSECAVVGDGGNDMDMFKVSVGAGGLAMAMDNARADLKKLATHILPRYDQDGATAGLNYIIDNFAN